MSSTRRNTKTHSELNTSYGDKLKLSVDALDLDDYNVLDARLISGHLDTKLVAKHLTFCLRDAPHSESSSNR